MGVSRRRYRSTGETRWFAEVQHDGRRVRSRYFRNKWQAEDAHAEMRRAIQRGTWHKDFGEDRLPTLAEAVLEHLAGVEQLVDKGLRAAGTLAAKRTHLHAIEKALGPDERVDRISKFAVERLKRRLLHGRSGPTVNRYLASLQTLLGEYVVDNPVAGVERYDENPYGWHVFEEDALAELVKAARADCNPHIAPLIIASYDTLIRARGLLGLRVADVDWRWRDRAGVPRGLIRVRQSKSRRPLRVPMTTRARDELRAHAEGHGGEWVFVNRFGTGPADYGTICKARRRALKAAGLDPALRLHDLRHSGATHLIRIGASREAVRTLLGHRTRVMVDRYVHMTAEDAAEAVALADRSSEVSLEHGAKTVRSQETG